MRRGRSLQAFVIVAIVCLTAWTFIPYNPDTFNHDALAADLSRRGGSLPQVPRPQRINDDVTTEHLNATVTPTPGTATAEEKTAASEVTPAAETLSAEDNATASEVAPMPSDLPVSAFVQSILDPQDTTFPRLTCPASIGERYSGLKKGLRNGKIQYFLALNLYEVAPLLPRLMGTVLETIKYLGPRQCALSIIEGRSDDNTYQILDGLKQELRRLGVEYYLDSSAINPHGEGANRIRELSTLRNMAIAPMLRDQELYGPDTIINFINDVAACPEDILELLYQHKYQNATQTCAFDWIHDGGCFYDVWVSRSLTGDTFFEIPQSGSWDFSENMFWDHDVSKAKFGRVQPFQVYACWGGMVTLDARPFLNRSLEFRASVEENGVGECYLGEPTTLAKDMWKKDIARIVAVPSVNLGYSNEEGAKIKKRRGFVSDHVNTTLPAQQPQTESVEWQKTPPGHLKCLPEWSKPSWVLPV